MPLTPQSHPLLRQPFVHLREQLFTVQKSEELHESGAAPYSDASCAVVSMESTSLTWSDRTAPQLGPLQLLAHAYMYTMDFITMHVATYYFGLLGWHTFE